jgi:hypothetical protein
MSKFVSDKSLRDRLLESVTDNLWIIFGDFLDDFYKANNEERQAFIKDDISWVEWISKEDKAMIAASVNFLANKYDLETPLWVFDREYFLDEPVFAMDAKGVYKIYLLTDSPKEFRMRNLFVERNCLDRV